MSRGLASTGTRASANRRLGAGRTSALDIAGGAGDAAGNNNADQNNNYSAGGARRRRASANDRLGGRTSEPERAAAATPGVAQRGTAGRRRSVAADHAGDRRPADAGGMPDGEWGQADDRRGSQDKEGSTTILITSLASGQRTANSGQISTSGRMSSRHHQSASDG